jgi:dTDP-4-amino-4,6-dideoxygalactose transaminase
MRVKFTNLYKLAPEKKRLFNKIQYLIKKSIFVGGIEVDKFENNFSKFTKSKYCVALANGTDALEIAVKSLNLKKGSEIIVPVNTWISTAEAVVNNGYKLVFCDVNLDDYSICLKDLKKKVSRNTSAIIAVHLYGNPSDMPGIKKIIKEKKIKLIEDCAQAHGAKINKKHVGNFGDVGTFSFFPGKNLGAFGDAGAIITNSKKVADYSLRDRNHGAFLKYDHLFAGRNSRLDSIQAGVLNIKLKSYNKVVKLRNNLAKLYFKELKSIKEIKLFSLNKKNQSVFHQFVIRVKNRNKLRKYLTKHNIETLIHYPYMLNELNFFPKKRLFKANKLGNKILSLPISEEHSKKEIYFVIKTIKNFFKKNK